MYEGADSTPGVAGDGHGPVYTNWDKDSSAGCKCDSGYFGADCSLGGWRIFTPRSRLCSRPLSNSDVPKRGRPRNHQPTEPQNHRDDSSYSRHSVRDREGHIPWTDDVIQREPNQHHWNRMRNSFYCPRQRADGHLHSRCNGKRRGNVHRHLHSLAGIPRGRQLALSYWHPSSHVLHVRQHLYGIE